MSIGAGSVLILNARPSCSNRGSAPPLAASAATAHEAPKSVDPFGEVDRRCMGAWCASNGRILWLSLL